MPTTGDSRENLQVLKQRACWAFLNVAGWTTERISQKFAIAEETVRKGIYLFRERLPDDRLIPAHYRPLVSLLRGDSNQQDKKGSGLLGDS